MTLVLEGTGTLLLALRFCPEMGLFRGLWYAVFHAVSSFCNAGFDLMGAAGTPFVSLTGYAGDPLVNFTVMGLIVLGGIGFLTWGDVREHKWHLRAYCLQSKLVLAVTAALILLPALFFLLYELRLPQWQTLTLGEKVQGALFQAVTPRTAGYNTLDLSQLSEPSRLLITLLMLVGGSPAPQPADSRSPLWRYLCWRPGRCSAGGRISSASAAASPRRHCAAPRRSL